MNQRASDNRIIYPEEKIPVALVSDFLNKDVMFPQSNLKDDGLGVYYQLLVGRGSQSTVSR
jgi:hypothetical protein